MSVVDNDLTLIREALVGIESAVNRDIMDYVQPHLDAIEASVRRLGERATQQEARLAFVTAERDLYDARCCDREGELAAAQREVESQMQAKLDAQVTLKAVTEALDLRFDQLGDGWRDVTLVILDRIGVIVDETERLAGERDAAVGELAAAQEALRKILATENEETNYDETCDDCWRIAREALSGRVEQ